MRSRNARRSVLPASGSLAVVCVAANPAGAPTGHAQSKRPSGGRSIPQTADRFAAVVFTVWTGDDDFEYQIVQHGCVGRIRVSVALISAVT